VFNIFKQLIAQHLRQYMHTYDARFNTLPLQFLNSYFWALTYENSSSVASHICDPSAATFLKETAEDLVAFGTEYGRIHFVIKEATLLNIQRLDRLSNRPLLLCVSCFTPHCVRCWGVTEKMLDWPRSRNMSLHKKLSDEYWCGFWFGWHPMAKLE
jgi:hypothetical protein